jgi:hypothetical protein
MWMTDLSSKAVQTNQKEDKMLRSRTNRTATIASIGTNPMRTTRRIKRGGADRVSKSWLRRIVAAIIGMALVGGGAYAATNWVVGLNAGSTAESQSANIANLTITAVASPAATNLLFPGGNGDVVATIANPNPYPVTITSVDLPANTSNAIGYTSSGLGTANGCTAANSDVTWNYSTGVSGTVHALTSPLTVAASGSLVVTFTNDASMALAAPAACVSTYFSMFPLAGVVATGGAATATTSPATDAWTS